MFSKFSKRFKRSRGGETAEAPSCVAQAKIDDIGSPIPEQYEPMRSTVDGLTNDGFERLCPYCSKLDTFAHAGYHVEHTWIVDNAKPRMSHHTTLHGMEMSAKRCALCDIFLSLFKKCNGETVFASLVEEERAGLNCTIDVVGFIGDEFRTRWLSVSQSGVSYESYAIQICYEKDPMSQRAIWKSTVDPDFDQRKSVLRNWLQSCNNDHDCPKPTGYFPARLIHIRRKNGEIRLRLVTSKKARRSKRSNGRYAALSHCWGDANDMLQTTSNNLELHLQNIPTMALPKNFRDAVMITKSLGVEFLWIDSLCIVQDDEVDWQSQSSEMADVYRNAFVTIAAADSMNAEGGCLAPPAKSLKVKFWEPHTKSEPSVFMRAYVCELLVLQEFFSKSPLNKRGWTLQETTLSARVVYFTSRQMLFRCGCGFQSEDGYIGRTFPDYYVKPHLSSPQNFGGELDPRTHYPDNTDFEDSRINDSSHDTDRWWNWVEDYSSRTLTFLGDKFAAFAGLTDHYQSTKDDLILAGLRKSALPIDLLWAPKCTDEPQPHAAIPDIPSWSWYSTHRAVEMPPLDKMKAARHITPELRILDHSFDWSGRPNTSWLKAGRLHVEGELFAARIHEGTRSSTDWGGLRNDYRSLIVESIASREAVVGCCILDDQLPQDASSVFCLIVATLTQPFTIGFWSWAVLVLQRTESEGVFRRIGIGVVERDRLAELVTYEEDEYFTRLERRQAASLIDLQRREIVLV